MSLNLFIVSVILSVNAFALTVVLDPYRDINYDEIQAYDLTNSHGCDCHEEESFNPYQE